MDVHVIEFTEANDIPGVIILLDIQKAFNSVNHDFMIETSQCFNIGTNFIKWVKTIVSGRKSYVINNGFMTKAINMKRGIFQ